jgi:hypothetical protein
MIMETEKCPHLLSKSYKISKATGVIQVEADSGTLSPGV